MKNEQPTKKWFICSGYVLFQTDNEVLAHEEIMLLLASLEGIQSEKICVRTVQTLDPENIEYPADRQFFMQFTGLFYGISQLIKECLEEAFSGFSLENLSVNFIEMNEGRTLNEQRIAIGAGTVCAIVPKKEIYTTFQLKKTGVKVRYQDFFGTLHKGSTYEDSRKIDQILDRYENLEVEKIRE